MKIPSRIRIKAKVFYEIVWQERIADDPDCLGLCDSGTRTIFMRLGMSESETLKTFIHEVLHALSAEHEFELPHKTVYALEDAIFRVLKLNGLLNKKPAP